MPFAQVGDQRLYYSQQGQRGLPVVFVHGSGATHLIWGSQVRALGEIARAVALDLPGHGKSSPPGRTAVAAYGEAVIGLLDALGFARAMIVGHSLGGAIAQSLGLSHPDRVAALGLVGTGARLRVLPAILEGILSATDYDATVQSIVEYSHAADLDPEMRRRAEEELRACAPQVAHDDFAACDAFDVMSRLGEIRAPTLILCGREDRLTPVKYSEFLAARIPGAKLVLIDRAGHSAMLEQPDEVNRALVEFVHSLPGAEG